MRKIFGGAMALSALGAVIMGGALAWTDSQEVFDTAAVGTMGWDLNYLPGFTPELGPDGEGFQEVGAGNITNTGDFNLLLKDSAVVISNVVPFGFGGGSCASDNFEGKVTGVGVAWDEPVAPLASGGEFVASIAVKAGAPEACQGDLVTYAVQIEVTTTGN